MRVSICKDDGEVFAIHEFSAEQCREWMRAKQGGFTDLSHMESMASLVDDIKTAIQNEANAEASQ